MSVLGDIAVGVSSIASLAGVPWQQYLQKELMHESEAINLRQWNRENEYNSPAEQMKRLKLAGLNPDLAIGGSPQNTADHAQLTDGTPQAPGAAAAVGSAVRNAQEAALIESQVDVNQAKAKKDSADADVAGQQLVELQNTFETRFQKLSSELEFSKAQTAELNARIPVLIEQVKVLTQQIDYYSSIAALNKSKKETEDAIGVLWKARAKFGEDFAKAELDKILQDANLSAAQSRQITQQVNFFADTWNMQKEMLNSKILLNGYMGSFYNQLAVNYYPKLSEFVKAQTRALPFQVIGGILNDPKYLKLDKDGNIILGKNGFPQFDHAYQGVDTGLSIVERLFGIGAQGVGIATDLMNARSFKKTSNAHEMSAMAQQTNAETNRLSFNLDKQKYRDYQREKRVEKKSARDAAANPVSKPWVGRRLNEMGQSLVNRYNSLPHDSDVAIRILNELRNPKYYIP